MEPRRPFSNKPHLIEITCFTLYETEKAVRVDAGDKEVWLPMSQLEDWPEIGCDGVVIMPEWLAKEKELI